jgi:hypothetical protein
VGQGSSSTIPVHCRRPLELRDGDKQRSPSYSTVLYRNTSGLFLQRDHDKLPAATMSRTMDPNPTSVREGTPARNMPRHQLISISIPRVPSQRNPPNQRTYHHKQAKARPLSTSQARLSSQGASTIGQDGSGRSTWRPWIQLRKTPWKSDPCWKPRPTASGLPLNSPLTPH